MVREFRVQAIKDIIKAKDAYEDLKIFEEGKRFGDERGKQAQDCDSPA